MPKRGGVGDEGESEGLGCQPGMPGNNKSSDWVPCGTKAALSSAKPKKKNREGSSDNLILRHLFFFVRDILVRK